VQIHDEMDAIIREVIDDKCADIRIAMCGNVDGGKSTLVSVLTGSKLDNGKGQARISCF